MSGESTLCAAGATPADSSVNNEDLTMGLSTTDGKVVIATESDPATAPPRVARACRDENTRNGVDRRVSVFDKLVHAYMSSEPSKTSNQSQTRMQVGRARTHAARTPECSGCF